MSVREYVCVCLCVCLCVHACICMHACYCVYVCVQVYVQACMACVCMLVCWGGVHACVYLAVFDGPIIGQKL